MNQQELDAFRKALFDYKDHLENDYWDKWHRGEERNPEKFHISFDFGTKYIKIVANSHGSKSSHSWIVFKNTDKEFSVGDILKSASWNSPARNFNRGSIYDPVSYKNRAGWTGVW